MTDILWQSVLSCPVEVLELADFLTVISKLQKGEPLILEVPNLVGKCLASVLARVWAVARLFDEVRVGMLLY
jgi:hypothetical protein